MGSPFRERSDQLNRMIQSPDIDQSLIDEISRVPSALRHPIACFSANRCFEHEFIHLVSQLRWMPPVHVICVLPRRLFLFGNVVHCEERAHLVRPIDKHSNVSMPRVQQTETRHSTSTAPTIDVRSSATALRVTWCATVSPALYACSGVKVHHKRTSFLGMTRKTSPDSYRLPIHQLAHTRCRSSQ